MASKTERLDDIRRQILSLTAEYSKVAHRQNRPATDDRPPSFQPGETIPYAGRVFTEDEVVAAVDSTLDFWLTLGKHGERFEKQLAEFLGVRRSLVVNSGSSANLVALSALTSHKLPADRRIRRGDEVITVAAGFPTTVSPIIQNGLTAVFIDADPITGNARVDQLADAYDPGKTKAVMMAHALGNPFDIAATKAFCDEHNLWLIEDNCDALGCTYQMQNADGSTTEKPTGAWGDLSTQSFYPPHHLTMGEGGSVNIVKQAALKVLVESFRDWGRDCWCPSGCDNTCNKRFGWQMGDLPEGYDHKYIYSHLGYNLKPLDTQAAIGSVQMDRLPGFVQDRMDNWQTLRSGLADLEDVIEFSLPTHATGWNADGSFTWDDTGHRTKCSWFGFKMSVRPNAPFTRTALAQHLDHCKIGNRMLFGGNLLKQPALVQMQRDYPESIRVVGEMTGADEIMNHTIFIGTYPGLTAEMLDYTVHCIRDFAGRVSTPVRRAG